MVLIKVSCIAVIFNYSLNREPCPFKGLLLMNLNNKFSLVDDFVMNENLG